jgi:hypothetical protein
MQGESKIDFIRFEEIPVDAKICVMEHLSCQTLRSIAIASKSFNLLVQQNFFIKQFSSDQESYRSSPKTYAQVVKSVKNSDAQSSVLPRLIGMDYRILHGVKNFFPCWMCYSTFACCSITLPKSHLEDASSHENDEAINSSY